MWLHFTMTEHDIPTKEEIEAFVDYSCINILSQNEYGKWVETEKKKKQDWAVEMHNRLKNVNNFLFTWKSHIELIGKREVGGLSNICSHIQYSMPISRSQSKIVINNCCLTMFKARPCFEIYSTRSPDEVFYVHHSLMEHCQGMWTLFHMNNVFTCAVHIFSQKVDTSNLSSVCKEFEASETKKTLVEFLQIVFRQIVDIFTKDNLFQPFLAVS